MRGSPFPYSTPGGSERQAQRPHGSQSGLGAMGTAGLAGLVPLNTGSHPLEEGDHEKDHQPRPRRHLAGRRASLRAYSGHRWAGLG